MLLFNSPIPLSLCSLFQIWLVEAWTPHDGLPVLKTHYFLGVVCSISTRINLIITS